MSSSGSPPSSPFPPSNDGYGKGNNDGNNGSGRHQHDGTIAINRRSQIVILLLLLFGFTILTARPFGFKTFLASMEHGALYPIVIVFGIIAVILVLMQRLGIIFVESSEGDGYA